ncbi:MAG: hypothetical protein R2707_18955 [Acidimicrobiales bacterium]
MAERHETWRQRRRRAVVIAGLALASWAAVVAAVRLALRLTGS